MQLVQFKKNWYCLVVTDHASARMKMRNLSIEQIIDVVETGASKPKVIKGKYWVYKNIQGREDNLIALSLAVEQDNLV